MYNYMDSYNGTQIKRPPKPTSAEILNAVLTYVYGSPIGRGEIEKVDSIPDMARHSCEHTGICILYKQVYNVLGNMANMYGWRLQVGNDITSGEVPFLFCNACGKLYLPKTLRVIQG